MPKKTTLPTMDADIVTHAEHSTQLGDDTAPAMRLHLSKVGGGTPGRAYDGNWEYAILLRAMSGWEVISHGTDVITNTPMTHTDVAEMITEIWAGEYGDGYDHLTPDRYTQINGRGDAHITRDDATYCGKPKGQPAVFDTKIKNHAQQHCINCNMEYRADNWGRCPVEAH
ncbi:hypothetical protein [Streptomyces sp. NPDC088727]|uniref:hypothetical protein n=1 Tax=Streptomyces sp. NPDC088727 TaxID=3365875 RepID=UPI0037FB3B0D